MFYMLAALRNKQYKCNSTGRKRHLKSAYKDIMAFQKCLLQVAQALNTEEFQALLFLCKNLLEKDISNFQTTSELFNRLTEQELLTPEQPYLLSDLLQTIQRHSLMRELNLCEHIPTTSSLISPYRKLLYELSENITQDELKEIKFLLKPDLPRGRLEDNVTTLQVFLEMEKVAILSNCQLNTLENILQIVCPMLIKKINQYLSQAGPITQETGMGLQRTRSSSEVLPANKAPSQKRTVSCGPTDIRTLPEISYPNQTDTAMADAQRANEEPSSGLCVQNTSEENSASAIHEPIPADTQTGNSKVCFKELGEYAMTGSSRGVCLIINNNDFSTANLRNRPGTDIDLKSLTSVFQWLGFRVQVKSDCSRDQMVGLIEELRCRDHSQNDCLVCCILSHGLEGCVLGVDGLKLRVSKITETFSGLKCKSLTGKPKLFFIQACQGIKEQQPVFLQSDSRESEGLIAHRSICTDALVPEQSIPSDSDFLLGMSTVPQCVSFRDRWEGTWYIQSLCQSLINMVPSGHDLLSILTKVNHDVSCMSDNDGKKKQMPQPAFSLRKKVVFPIPKEPPPKL
ncbi:hypothetical protein DPEC_G00045870 [Dallia pectoralis]|uniref:Uncharacterized protein n=1 Tax=Dallia pectoralis TaxID=75939 RepID=A0ACC2HAM9_DALPE|nr:hypothetical protein DPEC_G00045870 [Dallia pectoralis]